MKSHGVIDGLAFPLVESCRASAERFLYESRILREQERRYLVNELPALETYEAQVGAATSLLDCSRRRCRALYLLVEATIDTTVFADVPPSEMSDDALEELAFIRGFVEPRDPRYFNLKDLGWTLNWHDPVPDCVAYRNSIEAVEELDRPLSIISLLEYGLVPSDLDDWYLDAMRADGLLTDVSDRLVSEHAGDWRRVVRDLSLAGSQLH